MVPLVEMDIVIIADTLENGLHHGAEVAEVAEMKVAEIILGMTWTLWAAQISVEIVSVEVEAVVWVWAVEAETLVEQRVRAWKVIGRFRQAKEHRQETMDWIQTSIM